MSSKVLAPASEYDLNSIHIYTYEFSNDLSAAMPLPLRHPSPSVPFLFCFNTIHLQQFPKLFASSNIFCLENVWKQFFQQGWPDLFSGLLIAILPPFWGWQLSPTNLAWLHLYLFLLQFLYCSLRHGWLVNTSTTKVCDFMKNAANSRKRHGQATIYVVLHHQELYILLQSICSLHTPWRHLIPDSCSDFMTLFSNIKACK